ncbi:MAG: GNAT family N-acetyltransferase [Planctomycetaceae bacterium]
MRIILETRRLVLGEMSLDDLDFIAAMTADPFVMRWYPKRLSREQAAAGVRQQLDRYARDGIGAWLAREKSTGRPIGRIGLQTRPVNGVVETEIAWMIHRPFQRCGYASEGGAACRDFALTTLILARVVAFVRPENVPSCGVAIKLGLNHVDRTVIAGLEHRVYAAVQLD